MKQTRYTAKNKTVRQHIEYAVLEIEKIRENSIDNDGLYDVAKITQRENRIAKNLQSELDRRVSLDAEDAYSIEPETYRRGISYIKTCARNSSAKEPRSINNLIKSCPNKTYRKLVDMFKDMPKKEAVKAINSIKKKAVQSHKSVKTDAKKAQYVTFIECIDACLGFPDISMMSKIKFKAGMREQLNLSQEERVTRYQSKKNDRVFNFEKVHKLCVDLLGSSTRSNLPNIIKEDEGQRSNPRGVWGVALGIALATGRRPYEILYLSEFKALSATRMQVSNLAKKRKQGESIQIPVLINAYDIEKAARNLREDCRVQKLARKIEDCKFDGLQNRIFNDTVSKPLSEVAELAGKGILKDGNKKPAVMRFKDARDIFAVSAYEEHRASGGDLKMTRFVKENLGHEDLATALSYEKFRTSDVVSKGDIERVKRLEAKKEKRAQKLKNLLKKEVFKESKPMIKCVEYTLQKLEELGADTLVINGALLRKVDKGNGKIGALCRSEVITKFVKLIKAKNLDLPS